MSTAQLMPPVYNTWLNANGIPLAGGQIFSYIAGTSTPQATYTDETAGTPNTNPLVLNSAGQGAVWLRTDLSYKIVVEDSLNNVLATYDNINIINPGSVDKTKVAANIAGAALAQNGSDSFDVQVDNVYISVNGSNQLTLIPGAITPDFFPSTSKLEVIFRNTRDLTDPGSIKTIPQYEWTTPSLLAGPTGPGICIFPKWSPNGEFLAVPNLGSPYILIYQNLGGVLTKLSDPGTIPSGSGLSVSWSPCGDFLAVTTSVSPYLIIYQRSGNTFTKLSDPGTLPTVGSATMLGIRCFFSPNSDFLAVPYSTIGSGAKIAFLIYERSGTTFTDITTGSGLDTVNGIGRGNIFAWSQDSKFCCAVDKSTSLIVSFSRADATFTPITAPVASYSGNIFNFNFSPDGNFFSVALSITPWILIFQFSNGAFSLLTNPITLSENPAITDWAPNSEYLALAESSSPYLLIYKVTNPVTSPVFTIQPAVGTPPAAEPTGTHWSPTKQFLAVASATTPYIQIYKTASTLPGDSLLWSRGVPNI